MKLTFGRYPTRREVEEYYTRDDILDYICDASKVRSVVLSFRDEPSIHNEGKSSTIAIENSEELQEYLLQRFARNLPERLYHYEKPLGAYPSFHFITKGKKGEPWDFVMEADCHGWRKSFVDVRGAVEFLHEYGVPFMVKFSGHRSLHLIIPREAFPEKFESKPIGDIWGRVEGSLRHLLARKAFVKQAHGTGGILRLPYSLNENLGMVSLPIPYEDLDAFRPWESFHHLVRVRENFKLSRFIQECRGKACITAEFLESVLYNKSIPSLPRKMWSFSIREKPQYVQNMDREPSERAEEIWRYLPPGDKPDNDVIQSYEAEKDPDIRWFIAESLVGDERSFELLSEVDEYARCAIEDSITLQANESMSSFFDKIQRLGNRGLARKMRSILERLDFEVLKEELLRRVEISDESEAKQIIGWAAIASSVFNEWEFPEKISQEIQKRFPELLDETERKVLVAFRGLESDDIQEIRGAQRTLLEAGSRSVDQIILFMDSNKSWVRQRVMEVILKMNNPDLMECLVDAMGDENRKVRNMAVPALIRFGDAAKPLVEKAANTDNPRLRSSAIRVLTIIEGKESLGIAITGLESTNIKVKAAAIKSLSRIDDNRSHQALRSALWDVSSEIGLRAAYALADFGEKGVKILKDAVLQANAEGAEQALRCIAHGLAGTGDNSGIDYLISALDDESWYEWSTPWKLVELKDPRANDALLDYLGKNLLERQLSLIHI